MQALLEELPEDSGSAVITIKTDTPRPAPEVRQPGPTASALKYEPAMVYILELSTVLVVRDEETVEALGKEVAEALQGIIRNAGQYHHILVSRAVYYIFRLLVASYVSFFRLPMSDEFVLSVIQEHDYTRVPVLLHHLSSFSEEVLVRTSQQVLRGLRLCIAEPGPLRNEVMTSPDFWAILKALAMHPEASAAVFDVLQVGATGSPPAIVADNYESAIDLLSDFATAAGILDVPPVVKGDRRQTKSRPTGEK